MADIPIPNIPDPDCADPNILAVMIATPDQLRVNPSAVRLERDLFAATNEIMLLKKLVYELTQDKEERRDVIKELKEKVKRLEEKVDNGVGNSVLQGFNRFSTPSISSPGDNDVDLDPRSLSLGPKSRSRSASVISTVPPTVTIASAFPIPISKPSVRPPEYAELICWHMKDCSLDSDIDPGTLNASKPALDKILRHPDGTQATPAAYSTAITNTYAVIDHLVVDLKQRANVEDPRVGECRRWRTLKENGRYSACVRSAYARLEELEPLIGYCADHWKANRYLSHHWAYHCKRTDEKKNKERAKQERERKARNNQGGRKKNSKSGSGRVTETEDSNRFIESESETVGDSDSDGEERTSGLDSRVDQVGGKVLRDLDKDHGRRGGKGKGKGKASEQGDKTSRGGFTGRRQLSNIGEVEEGNEEDGDGEPWEENKEDDDSLEKEPTTQGLVSQLSGVPSPPTSTIPLSQKSTVRTATTTTALPNTLIRTRSLSSSLNPSTSASKLNNSTKTSKTNKSGRAPKKPSTTASANETASGGLSTTVAGKNRRVNGNADTNKGKERVSDNPFGMLVNRNVDLTATAENIQGELLLLLALTLWTSFFATLGLLQDRFNIRIKTVFERIFRKTSPANRCSPSQDLEDFILAIDSLIIPSSTSPVQIKNFGFRLISSKWTRFCSDWELIGTGDAMLRLLSSILRIIFEVRSTLRGKPGTVEGLLPEMMKKIKDSFAVFEEARKEKNGSGTKKGGKKRKLPDNTETSTSSGTNPKKQKTDTIPENDDDAIQSSTED